VSPTVLVIDDEPSVGRSLERLLGDSGYRVAVAPTASTGLARAQRERPMVVLLDHNLPDGTGLDVLASLLELDPRMRVVAITAFGDTSLAVRFIKAGACDFLTKPYDMEKLLHTVDAARRDYEAQLQLSLYRMREHRSGATHRIVGESPALLEVLTVVEKVARSDATSVLLSGESGTGKELVARAIHDLSERAAAPFTDLNCSSFSEGLLENELFGHEKGAYTDAAQTKLGLVELTDGGTLFLDEVGDMPELVQAKLLRFLDSRTFKRVGGVRELDVDIRVVTASNKDLPEEIRSGRFREDLYYRLKVVSIHLPPLRERGEDVILLAQHFLELMSQRLKKRFDRVSPEARRALLAHTWPGNVRELRNVIERAVLLEEGPALELRHLPKDIAREERAPRFLEGRIPSLQEVEDHHLLRVLEYTGDNKSQAARLLGISRQSLLDRLKRLDRERVSPAGALE
jgi:two-component system, NtrC family, response regulator AtoC